MSDEHAHGSSDFIRDMIRSDVAAGKHGGAVVTRFPPEPNGHLHIGHAKAICVDFGVAKEFGGRCHLRMDDTNPTTENMDYVRAIQNDVKWLGFDWGEHMYFASDYFERFYELAEKLIVRGRAYVCDLPDEEFSKNYRGTITEHGKDSPYRARSADENLDLFRRMRKGEFKDGEKVLRARIDMTSPNMKMRDPPLVRIKHAHHYRTGDAWCIYPLYDYAHCLEDSFEGVTHSLCTLEFESARELYDWVIQATEVPHVPRQTEFARLNVNYTVMSKRKLLQLVEGKHVSGWDDPRMPTIAGLRRRGYTPESIREFCARVGVARNVSTIDVALLEHTVREDLDTRSPRVMCVVRPVKLVVENWPEGEVEQLDAPYWPQGTEPREGVLGGSRTLPFGREIFIEASDFEENPPKGYHRLAPGRQVRLRHAYVVTCTGFEKNEAGEVTVVRCTHDPATRGGVTPDGKRIEGTIHWVSAPHAVDVEVRLYDRLCKVENPGEDGRDFLEDLNPHSLEIVRGRGEPCLAKASAGERFQFERTGFFYADPDTQPGKPVFNRTVALKDSWQRTIAKKEPAAPRAEAKPKAAAAPAKALPLSPGAQARATKFQISDDEARIIDEEPLLTALFDGAVATDAAMAKAVAALLVNDVRAAIKEHEAATLPFDGTALLELATLTHAAEISKAQSREVLLAMFASGKAPRAIVAEKGMKQIASHDALGPIVDAVLASNADVVERYKSGNANVLGALVGMVMKQTKGQGNAKVVTELLKTKLG